MTQDEDRAILGDAIASIDALERAGRLAEARDQALAYASRFGDSGRRYDESRLLARASELALYTRGIEAAEILARRAAAAATVAEQGGSLASDADADAIGAKKAPFRSKSSFSSPESSSNPLESHDGLGSESSRGTFFSAIDADADADARRSAVVEARLALARIHLRRHTDDALDDAARELDAVDDALDAPHDATRLKLRGLVHSRRGQPRDALACFAGAYRRADGYPALRARVLLTWAIQLRNWGLYTDARRLVERSLELRLQLGDDYGAAMCYGTLAFIHQRQGSFREERDALVADLRVCERIGGTADIPGLRARLAGALIGLGKYEGAWAEAEAAILAENRRLQASHGEHVADEPLEIAPETATRTHAFAWREMARACLAQDRIQDGLELVARAGAVFERVRDGYGLALCRLSEAQLCAASAAQAEKAGNAAEAHAARGRIQQAVSDAQPTFVRLGAVPEAAESILIRAESDHLSGDSAGAADIIAQQVLPMLRDAGLGESALYRQARELLQRMAPERAIEHVVTRAAMLRSLAAIMTETDAQPGTAVAALVGEQARARAFALSAVDQGAVVLWPDSRCALAAVLGPDHEARAAALMQANRDVPLASAAGIIDLEHMWPTGVRARGEPVDRALAALRRLSADADADAGARS